MDYHELLARSPAQHLQAMIWRLPGCGASGKVMLCSGAALELGREAQALGGSRALVLMGRRLATCPEGEMILSALSEAGISSTVYSQLPPEPHYEDLEQMADALSAVPYDIVIGIGGGSVMDMAKLCAHGSGSILLKKVETQDFSQPPLPLILMPTTSGTGSEVSPYTVLTIAGKKVFFSSPHFLPTVALVDPLLTVSAPPRVTAATGFDAMTHALEGAMARPTAYTQALAIESTAQIMTFLPKAVANGEDLEARYQLALASVMGMMSYAMGGGLYAHSISYILTLEKDQPHGLGCGMALPYTLAMNEAYIGPLLSALAGRCLGHGAADEDGRAVINAIHTLFKAVGLPGSLQELGYQQSDIPAMAELLLSKYGRKNNPRQLTLEDSEQLFASMLDGVIRYF